MPQHDLVVIGGGPGGYTAAVRAAQLGLKVACVEREPLLGGTCLRIGCIPSKALLEATEQLAHARDHLAEFGVRVSGVQADLPAMLKRKDEIVGLLSKGVDGLFKKFKVTRYAGHGRIVGHGRVDVFSAANGETGKRTAAPTEQLEAKHVLIATGSVSAPLQGVELDYDHIGTSTEALAWTEVPRHLVVIGAGYIGLELGCVWRRLGAKVTVLEYLDRILPGTDEEIASEALKLFKRQGLEFHLGARVTAARLRDRASRRRSDEVGICRVEAAGLEPIHCDRVLLAVGRVPNTADLGLDAVGLKPDEKGRIPVDERFATPAAGVYAIGDVIRGPMLAHKAEHEAVACVDAIVRGHAHMNYDAIPAVCYTEPEIAGVGRTEDQLKAEGRAYRSGVYHFRANGRARALGRIDGRVKVLAEAQTDRILGVHIIGPRAGDLIAEAAAAIEFGASSEDLAHVCHAHPTLAECLREAARAAGVE